jgi:TetR/AcrR family transcriptional regulator
MKSRLDSPRDAEATRGALIAAATELFAQRGYSGAKTEMIARRAGVNKAMINYHFGGKAGLYETIVVSSMTDVTGRLRELVSSDLDASELLRSLLDTLLDMHRTRPALSAMLLREAMSGGEHLSDDVLPQFVKVFGTVREIVNRGVREGAYRPVDPLLTHLTILGSVLFFFSSTPMRQRLIREGLLGELDPPTPDRFIDHLHDLFLHGLSTDPADTES